MGRDEHVGCDIIRMMRCGAGGGGVTGGVDGIMKCVRRHVICMCERIVDVSGGLRDETPGCGRGAGRVHVVM